MQSPHVLAIPYPAQGHVIPLLELVQFVARHGVKITFVNTEFNQERVTNALSKKDDIGDRIHLVSIPDGLEAGDDRNEVLKLTETISQFMPGKLVELIEKINESGDKITCIIADPLMEWALEVAEKIHIRRVAFWAVAAGHLAVNISIPKLLDDGIIDDNGTPVGNQMIQLSPNMPSIGRSNLVWTRRGELTEQKFLFEWTVRINKAMEVADWIICNSSDKLEPGAFVLFRNLLPIGPLLARHRLGKPVGCFWPEDSTCLEWLDQQPTHSVIYVAFGSFTVFDEIQFQELALGLELTGRPFIWVVRPDLTHESNDAYPVGFRERVATHGRLVGWAPQQEVLSHPSIACFLSHCGWNSTMEGLSNGIPFLCWPYIGDQFFNESYICDIWKIGLRFNRDESGIVRKSEIKDKVEHLLNDKTFRERALDLKEAAAESVNEGGCSHNNFNKLIEWMKTQKSCSNHSQA